MKNISFFILVFATFLFCFACEPPVVFMDAQPEGITAKTTFDIDYQGTYFCDSDSAWVQVKPTVVYKEKTFAFVTTRPEIEANEYIELDGNRAFINYFNTYVTVEDIGDGLLAGNVTLRDTLFEIGEKGILKSYKGHEIMNSQFDDGHWQVEILTLDKSGNLSYAKSKEPKDLKALEAITSVNTLVGPEGDTQYEIAPTKTEFKKILKTELVFEECDYFMRVRTKENL